MKLEKLFDEKSLKNSELNNCALSLIVGGKKYYTLKNGERYDCMDDQTANCGSSKYDYYDINSPEC